jgi:hypothetical protein
MAVNINVPSQVRTFANLAAFPASGSLKTIYIAEDTNKTYRWTGSVYVEISGADFSGYVPTSRTLTINGTTQDLSANRTFTIPTDLTVGTTPIASGTVGRVLFQGTGNVLQQSSSLFWDNTNARLGIGTETPLRTMDVRATQSIVRISSTTNTNSCGLVFNNFAGDFWIGRDSSAGNGFGMTSPAYAGVINARGNYPLYIGRNDSNDISIFTTGNIGINTTTDAGFRLDVNGTARVSGLTTLSGTMTASGAIARNQLINGTLVAAANNDVLIGLDVTPTFNLSSFPNITTLGMRLVSATNFSIMRMQNSAGNIDFGVGNSTLYFDSKTFATDFFVNSANRLRIATTGNLLINTTTDAGFRLDVNGTARIDQTLRVNGTGTDTAIQFRAGRIDADSNWIRIKSAGNVDMINIAQNFVGINATVATASAVLQADSTTRGFLPPRMTTTQKNAIASPAAGLMIYDTDLNRPCFYNGTSWITL